MKWLTKNRKAKLRLLLPLIMVKLTGGQSRYLPDIEWSGKSWVHNIFRVYEMIFFRRYGIRAEMSSACWRDEYGVQRVAYWCHSWESVFALAETQIRELLAWRPVRVKVWIPVLQTPQGIPFFASPYLFAIAIDVGDISSSSSTSPVTYSHTVTGSSPFISLCGGGQGTTATNSSAASYNSVAATKAIATAGGTTIESSLWFLGSCATGSNTVSMSFSPLGGLPRIGVSAVSYSGAQTGNVADATGSTTGTTTGAKTFTVTTVADNCWVVACCVNQATSSPTAAATQTSRASLSLGGGATGGVMRSADLNGVKSPAGSQTMGYTIGASVGESQYSMCGASFAPGGTTISVSDSITITDVVTDIIRDDTRDINKSDSITISESRTMLRTSFISVTDSLTVGESVTMNMISFINVSDALTLSEFVNVTQVYNVSVSDALTITESKTVTNANLGSISVSDSLTVSESVSMLNIYDLHISDSITITESVLRTLISNVSVSDSLSIAESVALLNIYDISVNDSLTITETVTVAADVNTDLTINVSDALTLTEVTTITNPTLAGISVSDSLSIGESLTMLKISFISVTETITITELLAIVRISDISVTDSITIAESTSVIRISNISTSDVITVAESIAITNTQLGPISVADALTITESTALTLISLIFISDAITITESVTVFIPFMNIAVSDSISITESLSLLEISNINVSDALSITEAITLLRIGGTLTISVSDSLIVSEAITMSASLGGISVSDSITVTDVATMPVVSTSISVSDSIHITESVTMFASAALILPIYKMRSQEDRWPFGMDDQTLL